MINSNFSENENYDDLAVSHHLKLNEDLVFEPLHLAALTGNLEKLASLIKDGHNVDSKSSDGDTPVYLAALNGHWECVKYLVEKRANCNLLGHEGNSVMHLAAQKGKLEILKFLLSNGALISALDLNSENVLHYACEEGDKNLELIEFLSLKYPRLNTFNVKSETPTYICIYMNQFKALSLIIKCGIEPDNYSKTLLRHFKNEIFEYSSYAYTDFEAELNSFDLTGSDSD